MINTRSPDVANKASLVTKRNQTKWCLVYSWSVLFHTFQYHFRMDDFWMYVSIIYQNIFKLPRDHLGTFCCFFPQMEFFLQSSPSWWLYIYVYFYFYYISFLWIWRKEGILFSAFCVLCVWWWQWWWLLAYIVPNRNPISSAFFVQAWRGEH